MEPEDIESKEFMVSLRGYDKDQVRDFLTEVAAQFRRVSQGGASNRAVEEQLQALSAQISSVMRSLVEEASSLRAEAVRDAETLRSAALQEAGLHSGNRIRRVLDALRESP